jgi:DNA-binding beta-propeller fold protein YncE
MLGKNPVEGTEKPALSLDGSVAYFPTPGYQVGRPAEKHRLLVIDTTTDEVVEQIPMLYEAHTVHVTATGKILVGKCHITQQERENGLAVYDPDTYALMAETKIIGMPLTLRSSPCGLTASTANALAGTVSVVALLSMRVVKTLKIDTKPNAKTGILRVLVEWFISLQWFKSDQIASTNLRRATV